MSPSKRVRMTQNVEIRSARRSDEALLRHYHQRLYQDFRSALLSPSADRPYQHSDPRTVYAQDVRAILSDPRRRAYIAINQGNPVGYITGHIEEDDRRILARRGVIEEWYVEDTVRGQGIGRLLLDQMLRWFRKRECGVAESRTWTENKEGRARHVKAGFRECEIKYRMPL